MCCSNGCAAGALRDAAAAPVADRCGLSARSGRWRSTPPPASLVLPLSERDAADDLGAPGIVDRRRSRVAAPRSDRSAGRAGYRRLGGRPGRRRAEDRRQADRSAEGRTHRYRRSRPRSFTPEDVEEARQDEDPKITDGPGRAVRTHRWRRKRPPCPSVESARHRRDRPRRHSAPATSSLRERVTWEKELAAHFDKFKRYPAGAGDAGRASRGQFRARPAWDTSCRRGS